MYLVKSLKPKIFSLLFIVHNTCSPRYHQKVPAEPTELESTPQYGVASPVEFPIPAPAPVWTADFLAGFQVSKSQPKVTAVAT